MEQYKNSYQRIKRIYTTEYYKSYCIYYLELEVRKVSKCWVTETKSVNNLYRIKATKDFLFTTTHEGNIAINNEIIQQQNYK